MISKASITFSIVHILGVCAYTKAYINRILSSFFIVSCFYINYERKSNHIRNDVIGLLVLRHDVFTTCDLESIDNLFHCSKFRGVDIHEV